MNGADVQHADLIIALKNGASFASAAGFHDGSAEILLANAGSPPWTLLHTDAGTILSATSYDTRPSL